MATVVVANTAPSAGYVTERDGDVVSTMTGTEAEAELLAPSKAVT